MEGSQPKAGYHSLITKGVKSQTPDIQVERWNIYQLGYMLKPFLFSNKLHNKITPKKEKQYQYSDYGEIWIKQKKKIYFNN